MAGGIACPRKPKYPLGENSTKVNLPDRSGCIQSGDIVYTNNEKRTVQDVIHNAVRLVGDSHFTPLLDITKYGIGSTRKQNNIPEMITVPDSNVTINREASVNFKIGDMVRCIDNSGNTISLTLGKMYLIRNSGLSSNGKEYIYVFDDKNDLQNFYSYKFELVTDTQPLKETKTMFTEFTKDTKEFIQTHKQTIYMIAFLVIVDHLVFQGAFRQKLKSLMDSVIGKVQEKVEKA